MEMNRTSEYSAAVIAVWDIAYGCQHEGFWALELEVWM